jgi:hypothetical protein
MGMWNPSSKCPFPGSKTAKMRARSYATRHISISYKTVVGPRSVKSAQFPPCCFSSRTQDLVPITHYLQNSTDAPFDEEYINITMQLSYRGVGALQASLADKFIPYNIPRTNTSEREQRSAQDAAELLREYMRYVACAPCAHSC